MTRRMHAVHRRRLSVALLCALALALFAAASPPGAAAQSGTCHDPVPDPFAAGWVQEGNQPQQGQGSPLIVRDPSNQPGTFINFYCPTDVLLAGEIALAPKLSIDGGFVADGQNIGVHVTINDGTREIRAMVFDALGGRSRVALVKADNQTTTGFTFNNLSPDFVLKRLADGTGVLSAPSTGMPDEQIPLTVQAFSSRPGVQTLEFGSHKDFGASSTSRWTTLGLPPVPACQNTPSAILPPINADGTSNFKLGRTISVGIRVLDCDGNPVDTLAPQVALQKLGAGGGAVNEVASSSAADSGTTMRSTGDGYYHFNLSTKQSQFNAGQDLTEGRYRLTLSEPSFPSPVEAEFDLRR